MGKSIGSIAGGALGFAVGGPAGASIGAGLGGSLGGGRKQGAYHARQSDPGMKMLRRLDDPMSAQDVTQQVQQDPITGQFFGEQGLMQAMAQDEQAMRGGLTEDDRTAFGQASGDITRMAGQQEQQLARAMQQRGLGAAPSGAQAAGISGIQGNKFEQLAGLQTNLAKQREQQLAQSRQQLMQMGQMGMGAQQQAFGQDMARGQFGMSKAGLMSDMHDRQQRGLRQSTQDKEAAKGVSLFDSLSQGIHSGASGLGQAGMEQAGKSIFGGGFGG